MSDDRQERPDYSRPLPREERVNLGWLLDVPARALERGIVESIVAAGFADLRASHGRVFETIHGEGSRITDMAARAVMTKQSMQVLVDDLERLGYAERIPDPTDRRAKLVRLTPRGREAVDVGRRAIRDLEGEWARRLGKKRMGQLRELLADLGPIAGEGSDFGPE